MLDAAAKHGDGHAKPTLANTIANAAILCLFLFSVVVIDFDEFVL